MHRHQLLQLPQPPNLKPKMLKRKKEKKKKELKTKLPKRNQ